MSTINIAAKKMAGVVVGAGKMMKTVKVRLAKEEWNRHLRKVSEHLQAKKHSVPSKS
jgi:ribosomal protein S17